MKIIHSFKKYAVLALLLVGVLVFTQVFALKVQAGGNQQSNNLGNGNQLGGNQVSSFYCGGTPGSIHGELWSSTIGWIYLNCADAPGTGLPNFGVNQDQTTGDWSGYGWSPEIGWVKFGGVGCPVSGSSQMMAASGAVPYGSCDVQQLLTTSAPLHTSYPIVGWARACSATANPQTTCDGDNTNAGDWDGYISMSGLNDQSWHGGLQATGNYGASRNKLAAQNDPNQYSISGFVWGADDIGWAKFENAYFEATAPGSQVSLNLSANPTSVADTSSTTTLTYSLVQASDAQYFTGAACTTTSTPAVGSPWDGTQPNFSSTNTTEPAVASVPVSATSVVYTISCPVSVPNSTQTAATATITVTAGGPNNGTPNLSVGANDLCVESAQNTAQQSTPLSWTSPSNANYVNCALFLDGSSTAFESALPPNSSMLQTPIELGPFQNPTSDPYQTLTTPHSVVLKCYDNQGGTTVSNSVQVGVAPATFDGPTANGTLNCTENPNWGATLSGTNTFYCPSNPATLHWAPAPGSTSTDTQSALFETALPVAPTSHTASDSQTGLQPGLSGSASVTGAGYYWVYYFDASGTSDVSPAAGPFQISQGTTSNCQTYVPPYAGELCPSGSANQAYSIPFNAGWSSNADQGCILTGNTPTSGNPTNNGTFTVNGSESDLLTCSWNGGSSVTTPLVYTVDSPTNSFCTTPVSPPNLTTPGTPVVKEQ